ncbi:MAG: acetyl-CoA hydrolase/transferase C-terminal domain-containing protein [Fulvivirga sp.]|uniref:acetyl-CoA hydrolase/transferase family protein n=1 Tax=Fulvivirga sp. TaxID=1931237 RepID=UPI0032EA9C2D
MSNLKIVSAKEAIDQIKSNQNVFIQGAAMTPNHLINELCNNYEGLKNVNLVHMHTEGEALYTQEPYRNSFKTVSCFVGANVRKAINTGFGDYIPIFLSEIHQLFRRNIIPLDVAIIQVSPPDQHGFCSLGTSIDVTIPAIETAGIVIAQINKHVPRTHGDGIIHISKIDYAVEVDEPIHCSVLNPPSEIENRIGQHVSSLVEDGATLQMGIGGIPNVVLANLVNHKDLGIHTEMFSDGILKLVEAGVLTGAKKAVKPGKIVSCFAVGSQKLYDFMDNNPLIHLKEAAYTNDTAVIRKNPKVTAINSAIEIDITGQVCADTIGMYQFSGVGGQMDFIRGASLSEGGKAIIAMPSVTNKGLSKIVPVLKEGAGVTTTRAHVHYIATENGVVDLYGKSLKQRARALISIAHPDHQQFLEEKAFERFKIQV